MRQALGRASNPPMFVEMRVVPRGSSRSRTYAALRAGSSWLAGKLPDSARALALVDGD